MLSPARTVIYSNSVLGLFQDVISGFLIDESVGHVWGDACRYRDNYFRVLNAIRREGSTLCMQGMSVMFTIETGNERTLGSHCCEAKQSVINVLSVV